MVYRLAVCAAILAWSGTALKATSKALREQAETIPDFQPVKHVADTGPYSFSRNWMYVALLSLPVALGVALDSAWLLGSCAMLFAYLDRIVVPAEESFLEKTLGQEYIDYCERVPRWY